MPVHVALLGDSVFDNGAYTRGEPDVIAHLRSMLPSDWRASLLAVDGAVTSDLPRQLARVPADVSHLVVSLGGNDALMSRDLLAMPVRSTAEALALFNDCITLFDARYRGAIEAAQRLGRPLALCTIYNGDLPRDEAPLARTALTLFNDAILTLAIERRLPVIDLRQICCRPEDYANPIEPSGEGGRKIATAILTLLQFWDSVPKQFSPVIGEIADL